MTRKVVSFHLSFKTMFHPNVLQQFIISICVLSDVSPSIPTERTRPLVNTFRNKSLSHYQYLYSLCLDETLQFLSESCDHVQPTVFKHIHQVVCVRRLWQLNAWITMQICLQHYSYKGFNWTWNSCFDVHVSLDKIPFISWNVLKGPFSEISIRVCVTWYCEGNAHLKQNFTWPSSLILNSYFHWEQLS